MPRSGRRKHARLGLPPGSLVHIGERKIEKVRITVMDYDESRCHEAVLDDIEQAAEYRDKPSVSWVNIDGIHDTQMMEAAGRIFDIHQLVLADIMNTRQRPKYEAYDGYVFIVLKMLDMQPNHKEIIAEQISILISRNCVITFQEAPGDVLDALRDRIRGSKGRIRKAGPDFLANCIIDAILDGYFEVLDDLSDRVSDMEERLIEQPGQNLLQRIYAARRECLLLRKYIRPVREIITSLEHNESGMVRPETSPYIRDLYDHSLQILETMESLRDSITGMLEMYLSSASNRMNEVMKVLTVIATIFMPLTFIAGLYGMNLPNMPEMHWRYSYPAVWAVMLAVGGGMLWFFRRKRWV